MVKAKLKVKKKQRNSVKKSQDDPSSVVLYPSPTMESIPFTVDGSGDIVPSLRKKNKGVKGKKGKKGKTAKDSIGSDTLPPVIKTQQTTADEKSEDKAQAGKKSKKAEKKKGPKKKKMTKKEKARQAAELAEQQRLEMERQRMRLIQEEKERIERDRIAAEEKAIHDQAEQETREAQLKATLQTFGRFKEAFTNLELETREQEEWVRYLKCDGLPNPSVIPQMNTYLDTWQKDETIREIESVISKIEEVHALVHVMEDYVKRPLDNTLRIWKELLADFRAEQQYDIDRATYFLLRNMRKDMELIELREMRYNRETKYFTLCLWTLIPLPPSRPAIEKRMTDPLLRFRPPKTCDFERLGISVIFPHALNYVNFTLRGLIVQYDHYTAMSRSWPEPELPEEVGADLNIITQAEWESKLEFQIKVNEELERRTKERRNVIALATAQASQASVTPDRRSDNKTPPKGAEKEPPPDYTQQLINMQSMPPPKTASELFCDAQDLAEDELKVSRIFDCLPNELNLRKFTILGGLIYLDLLEQLWQPHELNDKCVISILNAPRQLKEIPFHVEYTPPPAPEPGQRRLPEEIEAELKLQEELLEMLSLVTVTLPDNVLWFEPPTVVRWNHEDKYWSTSECHDFKFNEEKQVLTFRLGQFGLLGLAAYRYTNLPYQTWDMKPDLKAGSIVLSITAAVVIVEFIIKVLHHLTEKTKYV